MELFFSGDWNQATFIIDGLQISEKLASALNTDGHLRWLVVLFAFGSFLYYLAQAVQKKVPIGIPFAYLIFIPFWLSFSFNSPVDIKIGAAPFESPLASEKSQIELQIRNLKASIKAQEDNGAVDFIRDRQALKKNENRLKLITRMINASSTSLGQAPLPVAYLYNMSQAISLGLWSILSDSHPSNLASMKSQALLLNSLSQNVQLSSTERSAAAQISNCIMMKNFLIRDIEKQQAMVSQNPKFARGPYAEEGARSILHERRYVERACNNLTKNVMDSIDKNITPAQIKSFNSAYQIPTWLPFLGGKTFGSKDQSEKVEFIKNQLHLSEAELKKMNSDEISKAFIRQKRLEQMGSDWMNNLIDPPKGILDPTGMKSSGFKSAAGSMFTDWLSDFALSVKPYLKLTISWAWHFALLTGAVMCLIALLPGHHLKAPIGYAFALLFLGVWQVTVNYIELYSSRLEAREIAVNAPSTTPLHYIGRLGAGMFDELTGDLEASDVAAAGVLGGKAVVKTGMAAWNLTKIKSVLSRTPQSAIITSGLSAVGYSTLQSYKKVNQQDDNYDKLMHDAATSINPALESLYKGYLAQQRTTMKEARSHASMMQAILLLMSPLITIIFFFAGYKMLSGMGVGAMAASGAQALGNTIGGSAVGKLGNIGGGGRPGGGK